MISAIGSNIVASHGSAIGANPITLHGDGIQSNLLLKWLSSIYRGKIFWG